MFHKVTHKSSQKYSDRLYKICNSRVEENKFSENQDEKLVENSQSVTQLHRQQ